jgi:hypothetical protein
MTPSACGILQAAATSRVKVTGLWQQAARSRVLGTIPHVPIADSRILPHLQSESEVLMSMVRSMFMYTPRETHGVKCIQNANNKQSNDMYAKYRIDYYYKRCSFNINSRGYTYCELISKLTFFYGQQTDLYVTFVDSPMISGDAGGMHRYSSHDSEKNYTSSTYFYLAHRYNAQPTRLARPHI